MNKIRLPIFMVLLFLLSCHEAEDNTIAFYHWKSKAFYSENINNVLTKTKANDIYLHYFDVDAVKEASYSDKGLYPVYVLNEVDEAFKKYNIIPVVFITNRTLQKEKDMLLLSDRIRKLIDEISLHHFGQKHHEIQLDCDWTASTKARYFELIQLLQENYALGVTIRLHQIKYPERTGVPPVKRGVLMLYNVGDLKDFEQNSILQADIVADYISEKTTYPLKLDVALPLFSQTILKSNSNEFKILNRADQNLLQTDTFHFRQKAANIFEVKNDTLYKGFYLSDGYLLKTEKPSESEIVAAYTVIKQSQLNIGNLIFYHLDDAALQEFDLDKILEAL